MNPALESRGDMTARGQMTGRFPVVQLHLVDEPARG